MTRVVVADDDATIRETLEYVLGHTGYEVVAVENGEDALSVLRAEAYPVVAMLDIVMPKLGGIGVLQHAAGDNQLAHKHAYILMTAFPKLLPPDAVTELLHDLQVPVLYKPWELDDLLTTVSTAAEKVRLLQTAPSTRPIDQRTPAF